MTVTPRIINAIVNLEDINESDVNSGIVMMVYTKKNCIPCSMLKNSIERLFNSNTKPAEFEPVTVVLVDSSDILQLQKLSDDYGISSVPYSRFLRNGIEWDSHVGFLDPKSLQETLNQL